MAYLGGPTCAARLEHGFLRVQCDGCRAEQLASAAPSTSVAPTVGALGERRGFRRGRPGRVAAHGRMAESAALLGDEAERRPVLPHRPMR